jgi:outer membrane protein OmpA-like peptidoglycan-associated protein
MRLTQHIPTLLTVVCLFGSGSDCVAQEKHFDQSTAEDATRKNIVADGVFVAVSCREHTENSRLARVSTPSKHAQPSSDALQEPAFLKQPLLFTPNAVNLTAKSKNTLNCAVAWLRQHNEVRILIVGHCDDSGSEACATALAERCAEVVRQFLTRLGTPADQIAGVKVWRNVDGPCRADTTECQRRNRSAHLFLASGAGSLK